MKDSEILAEVRKRLTGLLLQGHAEVFSIVEFIDKNRTEEKN